MILHRGRCVAFDEVERLTREDESTLEILVRQSVTAEEVGAPASDLKPPAAETVAEGTRLRFALPEGREAGDVVVHLVALGLSVEEVQRRGTGLEEIFLRLVHVDPAEKGRRS
jgi:hypothetical protein